MKITQDEVTERQTVLHIEVEDAELDKYLDSGYKRVVQRVAIPGFRRGKAPRTIVERYLGRERLIQESLDSMLPDVTLKAIEEQHLDAAGTPSVEVEELEPFKVKATVALVPEVELDDYQSIRVPKGNTEITEEDVQKRIDAVRKQAGNWVPVERPAKIGDMVMINLEGTMDNTQVAKEQDRQIVLEAGREPVPGFVERILGAKPEETREFALSYPEDSQNKELAGKKVDFKVEVLSLSELELPALDDSFAKSVSEEYSTFDDLKKGMEKVLRDEAQHKEEDQYTEAVQQALLERATIKLPKLLIDQELEHLQDRRDKFIETLQIKSADYWRIIGKTEEESNKELREQAVERLSKSYILKKLADTEKLYVSDQEIEDKIEELKKDPQFRDNKSLRRLDSPETKATLRNNMLLTKALDKIISIAKGEAPETAGEAPKAPGSPEEVDKGAATT